MAKRTVPGRQAPQATQPIWPGLTVEAILYAALIAGAAFVRFYDLGRWPLLTEEATQALAAWRFLQGQPVGVGIVPLPFIAALAGFFAFGANDVVARLLPALLGTALVTVPLALRRRLGTLGALAATFALAFSPSLVFYSRTLAGPMPALAGLGAVLVAVELAARGESERPAIAGGLGLAVAITSSPWVYSFLLAALLFLALAWLGQRRGRAWAGWPQVEKAMRAFSSDRRAWGLVAIPVALISTGFLLNVRGLEGTLDLLAVWLGRLVPGSGGRDWLYPLVTLAFYELGILLLGTWGLLIGVQRRNPWAGFLGVWAFLALLLAALSGARDGAPVVMAVLPLALLSGLAVTDLVARLKPAQWPWVAGCLFALSAVLGFWWVQAATYTSPLPEVIQQTNLALVGALVLMTPLFLAAVVLVFWFWVGRAETARAVTLLGLGLLASFLVRNTASLNFAHGRDAREPMLAAPSAVDVRDMVTFLADWSGRKLGDQHALAIAVQADLEPVVPWYLRDFAIVRLEPSPTGEGSVGAVVRRYQPASAPLPGYVGQRYRLRTSSRAPLGGARQALSWWLVRTGGGVVEAETCELWIRP